MPTLGKFYDLAAVLRAEGLTVVETDGWQARGFGPLHPVGVLFHHTAISKTATNKATLSVLTKGRPDLRGPLCNGQIRRDGTVVLVAGGVAHHAGGGSSVTYDAVVADRVTPGPGEHDDMNGNVQFIGWECDNAGDGEGWPPEQVDAMVRVGAALCRAEGWRAARCIGHREWTRRKVDPRGVDMDGLRTAVAHLLTDSVQVVRGGRPEDQIGPTWEESAVGRLPMIKEGAGANGPNGFVARLQGLLSASNQPTPITGVFDAETTKALKAWQKRAKVDVDGVAGQQTWQRLLGL